MQNGNEKANAVSDNDRVQILGQTRSDQSIVKRDRQIAALCLQGFNRSEIAKYIGVSRQRVWQILKSLGLETKPRKVTLECKTCQKSFTKFRSMVVGKKRSFCSRKCAGLSQRTKACVPCHACGKPAPRSPSRLKLFKRVFCSAACYYSVRQDRDYVPWREGQRKARRIVSLHFKLEPGNVVHHHDGNNRNNEPTNLAVFRNQADHMAHHHGVTPVEPLWDGRKIS